MNASDDPPPISRKDSLIEILRQAGLDGSSPENLIRTLPFSNGDVTCGVENELQAVVVGRKSDVDLPIMISESSYFRNIINRHRRGELPRRVITDLEKWLDDNDRQVWENSWVRIDASRLGRLARDTLGADLLADKKNPDAGPRNDAARFYVQSKTGEELRVPVSYLLKIALVDAVDARPTGDELVCSIGRRLAGHFLSDNSSPEMVSFYVAPSREGEAFGRAVAAESARRFLLTQLLTQYANRRFGLLATGQEVQVYFAPHPPVRQKELNDCITDSFYRELFMNPCLSGWDRGEVKHQYMHLCHQVLSRAQINAIARLKEAEIVTRNLVVLPSSSNISLANNGTHVSLGSRLFSKTLKEGRIGPAQEKAVGDLVIKFVEHFLPLFVGIYSAAPYRLDFTDFHPEKILSFLPYELDYTHLRMIWRRWKKKARLKVRLLGFRVTPFGPPLLDRTIKRVLGLKGDFVPDFRLLDYLVAIMGTDQCPALNGELGNDLRLKQDLALMGMYDPGMPLYLMYRQRNFAGMGFSGFEGRYYSVFSSFYGDMAPAVELQAFVTALAFQLIAAGRLRHADIPDRPDVESERRQVFFGSAIGLPTFFVRENTTNRVLKTILAKTERIRPSRRYPGYLRVRHPDYRRALVRVLREEGAALAERMNLDITLQDLEKRLSRPDENGVANSLTRGALARLGVDSPFRADARDFNLAAEDYYRHDLRRQLLEEGLAQLDQDLQRPLRDYSATDESFREAWRQTAGDLDPARFVAGSHAEVMAETAESEDLVRLIWILLLSIERESRLAAGIMNGTNGSLRSNPAEKETTSDRAELENRIPVANKENENDDFAPSPVY